MNFDFYSIGHSNISAARFAALLRGAGVTVVADVRSVPSSRFCPWFSAKNLAPFLAGQGIGYSACGAALGGRPRDQSLYCDGVADYEAMARQPGFIDSIDRLMADRMKGRICLMCAEREPLDCHRCLLVARALAERGATVGHILHDGTIVSHGAIERRLLAREGKAGDLFVTGQKERLAAAYRSRAREIAYRPLQVPKSGIRLSDRIVRGKTGAARGARVKTKSR